MNGRFLRAAARAPRRVTSGGAHLACALGVQAERSYEVTPGVSLRPTLQIGFAAVTMVNANLGRGRVDLLRGAVSLIGATTFFDAVFFPDAAATQGIGDNATWHIVEMGVWLSF